MPARKIIFLVTAAVATVLLLILVVPQSRLHAASSIQEKEQATVAHGRANERSIEDVYDIAPAPEDSEKRRKRQAKNRRYERGEPGERPLTSPEVGGGGTTFEGPVPQAIPIGESSAVIVGTVVKAQPYFSEYQTSVYSEFTVQVEEVLKNDASNPVDVGGHIVVSREGGALRLPGGRVVRYEVGGLGRLPRQGRRYVLFLKPEHGGQDLTILEGYELRAGKVFPLRSRPQYSGVVEVDFLNELRSAVQTIQAQKGNR